MKPARTYHTSKVFCFASVVILVVVVVVQTLLLTKKKLETSRDCVLEHATGPSCNGLFPRFGNTSGPSILPICRNQNYRDYGGNRHYSEHYHTGESHVSQAIPQAL